MEIVLVDNKFMLGDEYYISGDYEDGYFVTAVEDSDEKSLYENKSLENCIVWCLNS